MSDKPFAVSILWGEHREEGDQPITYSFATLAERAAFELGVDEMQGWAAYTIVAKEPPDAA